MTEKNVVLVGDLPGPMLTQNKKICWKIWKLWWRCI